MLIGETLRIDKSVQNNLPNAAVSLTSCRDRMAAQDRMNAIFLGYSVKDQAREARPKSEALPMAPKHSR
ncbi:MAG: hypothetical protein ABIT83_06525 [Massilia sp.]